MENPLSLFSRRPATLPATKYGYVPPPGATASSWTCANHDCNQREGEQPDLRRWPKRCPKCGSSIASDFLDEPWRHDAKRRELDVRLRSPEWPGDLAGATAEDIVWRFDDALRMGHPESVENLRLELETHIRGAQAADPYFIGGAYRWQIIDIAVQHRLLDLMVSEFDSWRAALDPTDLEHDNARRSACLQFTSRLISSLEDIPVAQSTHRLHLWHVLDEFMPRIRSIATSYHTQGYARVKRAMSGETPPRS